MQSLTRAQDCALIFAECACVAHALAPSDGQIEELDRVISITRSIYFFSKLDFSNTQTKIEFARPRARKTSPHLLYTCNKSEAAGSRADSCPREPAAAP